jgi:OOP family OmpA-OmpF porin
MSHGAVESPGLLGLVSRELTPDLVHKAALQLGENEDRTRSALSTSIPSVLTTLSDVVSSTDGAQHLSSIIHKVDSRSNTSTVASRISSSLGRDEGVTLFDAEAGDRAGPLAEAVARTSGVRAESAKKLLGGATGATLLALGRNFGRMGPDGLQAMLRQQRGQFVAQLPGPVASLFNGHAKAGTVTERVATTERYATGPAIRELPHPRRTGWIVPLVLLAALILIGIPLLRGLRHAATPVRQVSHVAETVPGQPEVRTPVVLPNGTQLSLSRGSAAYALSNFLAGSNPTPARFTLTPMNFGFNSTQLTPESMTTVNDVAAILKAYPTAAIRVESHTDNIGTEEANLQLSEARSAAVRGMLMARGVDASRIETAGLGRTNPIASNDTEAGRAQNRRTDIVVTGR